MSDPATPTLPPADDVLAAELALRVLNAPELDGAVARRAADPAFADAVAAWEARLMPWLDAIAPVSPDPTLWSRIAQAIGPHVAPANVVAISRRRLSLRDAGFALSGIAAALLVTVGLQSLRDEAPPVAVAPRASELAVAAVTPEGKTAALAVVSYDRVSASLIVTPAGLAPRTGSAYELWVIPATGGAPESLGLIEGAAPRRMVLADDFAASFAGVPTIAVSEEQPGGSRTGAPVGPVIGTGKLRGV